jgi:hypothetical protein
MASLSDVFSGAKMPGDGAHNFVQAQLNSGEPQLPQYDPQGGWETAKGWGRDIATMSTPGAIADAAGALGGPSMRENWNAGDKLAALFQGASIALPGAGKLAMALAPAAKVARRVAAPQHPISKLRLDRPISEMTRDVTSVGEMKPRVIPEPAELMGSTMISGMGDRTATNEILHGYNGTKLAHDTQLEGGPDFARANPTVWASAASRTKQIQDKANEVEDPILAYVTMGNRAGDFSHHISDALVGALPSAKISRANMASLNEILAGAVKGFPGLQSPDLRQFLLSNPGARTKFAKRLDMADARKLGAPDVGHARFATTVPDLIDTPNLMTGYTLSRLTPGASIIKKPDMPHTTYPTQIAGDYLGGLEYQLPPKIAFRDFYNAQKPETLANGAKLGRSIELGIPTQKVDQQWVDEASAYMEKMRNGGL